MRISAPLSPESGFDVPSLLAPEQAIIAFQSIAPPTPPQREEIELARAAARVLASDVVADADYPAQPRSLMDGYAIRAADAPGRLRLAAPANGRPAANGTAAPIVTGGALPPGADCVVPRELTRELPSGIEVPAAKSGGNIAGVASDMRAGTCVLRDGTPLGAAHLGVLATLGRSRVLVYRKPRIGVLSTGDELRPVDGPLAPGGVRDSNRFAIAATLEAMGADIEHIPTAPDRVDAIEESLRAALRDCDAVVTSGGSSVGPRDLIPVAIDAVARPGVIVHGLRLKPGKPTVLGAHGGKPIVGLPGNPVSTLMILEAVIYPLIASLTGRRTPRAVLPALLEQDLLGRPGWTFFVPVSLRVAGGELYARPLKIESFRTSLLVEAGGFAVLGEDCAQRSAGERVSIHRFSGGAA